MMLQRVRRALDGKTGQDWLEHSILGIAVALVLLAAAGTLGHRMSLQFVAVEATSPAASGEADAQGGRPAGASDSAPAAGPVPPTAADSGKREDEEDGFD